MTRVIGGLALVLALGATLFVGDQVVSTLRTLTVVERERDTWQRAEEILRHLDLAPGRRVVDFGSGAGYFALKMAPRVAPDGQVVAIDLRRQSLAFLWLRATLGGYSNLHVVHSRVDVPALSPDSMDAVLIANTYHELAAPTPILRVLFQSMRPGATLVVVDRGPRDTEDSPAIHPHEMTPAAAEHEIQQAGFEVVTRDDRFIDRPADEDIWWLRVFRRP